MRDPILISAFLSLGVCLTRAMCVAAKVAPPLCARCLHHLERAKAGDAICSCVPADA
jgi:hypothetical protein